MKCRPRKRTLLMLLLLLMGGAIINVAVAWGCLMLDDFRSALRGGGGRNLGEIQSRAEFESRPGAACFNSMFCRTPDIDYGDDPNDFLPSWSGFRAPSSEFQSGGRSCESRFGDARG